jgi:uncharacterized protein YjbI with pentapeptide repeats
MPDNEASPGPAEPPPTIRGKTFVLARLPPEDSTLEQITRLLAQLGGRVVGEVTPDLDYLVVYGRQPDRPGREERQAQALNEAGANVQVLDWAAFYDLLSPTREEALALLRGGAEGLAQWRLRRDSGSQTPIDLSGSDLRGAKLNNIVLYRVKLDGADLFGADLSGSSLGELVGVNLDCALLPRAYVPHLTDCTARCSDFGGVRFNPAVIVRTVFTAAKLVGADGACTRSEQAVFREADLTRAYLPDSTFLRADFTGANLTGAQLDHCDLTGSTFRGTNLSRATLCRAKLVNADLSGANLTGANLAGADLTEAAVEGANFEGANLYAAHLDALGPGRPLGLVPPPPVPRERIGPNMRRLEEVWKETGRLDTSLHIDPDGRGADFVELRIQGWGRSVRGISSKTGGAYLCQADTPCEAMLELAQPWPDADLYLETLRVRCGSVRERPRGLPELALAAWHEAFARPLPSRAERKARQEACRRRFLDLLRGGPEGVRQWNELRGEALARAGHFRRADLSHCDLRDANLSAHAGAQSRAVDFGGANFDGADLRGGKLHCCSLVKSSFRGALLDRASFFHADLREADFEEVSLQGSMLGCTRCRGASFRNADLTKANFNGADLCGADLSSAKLERARFEGTRHDTATRFPPGFEFPVKPAEGPPPDLEVGSRVRVTDGTFENMEGEVKEILESSGKVRVELIIFGRPVPVDLGLGQLRAGNAAQGSRTEDERRPLRLVWNNEGVNPGETRGATRHRGVAPPGLPIIALRQWPPGLTPPGYERPPLRGSMAGPAGRQSTTH